jgi:acetyl-CoA carboxylase carboxyltransferase component
VDTLVLSFVSGCTTVPYRVQGLITGVGRGSGRECLVVANDATVKGGTYYHMITFARIGALKELDENYA